MSNDARIIAYFICFDIAIGYRREEKNYYALAWFITGIMFLIEAFIRD